MFLLAHAGFALAPAAGITLWWKQSRGFRRQVPDLRWIVAGAVFPDLVDKTLGQVLFHSYFQNGRIFMHTFLVTLAFLLVGLWSWRRYGDGRLLLFAAGMLSHLVLDRIWSEPTTAFWPSLGAFTRHPTSRSFLEQIFDYMRDALFWAQEAAGAAAIILALRALGLNSLRDLGDFLRLGTLPSLRATRMEKA